jgi:acylphosphatase
MVAFSFIVCGRVQGVGFRYFVRKHALDLDIKGFVKNTSDGKVEGLIQGNTDNVSKLKDLIKKGPSLSRIECVDFIEIKEKDLDKFEIRF